MSVTRNLIRQSAPVLRTARPSPKIINAPRHFSSTPLRSNASTSSSSSRSSGSSKSPYAFGLLGLGSVGAYFGLGGKEDDPATTQEGMAKKDSEVDYQKVYNAVADGE